MVYTKEFKIRVVKDAAENNLTPLQVRSKYEISTSDFFKWQNIYSFKGETGFDEKRGGYRKNAGRPLKTETNDEAVKRRKEIPPPLPMDKKIYKEKLKEKDVNKVLLEENYRLKMENEYLKKLAALVQKKKK